jgi:hypothetical protein
LGCPPINLPSACRWNTIHRIEGATKIIINAIIKST